MNARASLPGNQGHHAVQVYRDDQHFCASIADFLADGIAAGQPTLVIATAVHCDLIVTELGARRFDAAALIESGALLLLDAHEMLDHVVVNGELDAARFEQSVGLAIQRLAATGEPTVRAYDELVDVLWRANQWKASLTVEASLNALLEKHPFSLLCGYRMDAFFNHPAYKDVCACHTHVHDAVAV